MDEPKKPAAPLTREHMIERLERSYRRLAADQDRLGTPTTALQKLNALNALIGLVKGQGGDGATGGQPPAQPGPPAAAGPLAMPSGPLAMPSGPLSVRTHEAKIDGRDLEALLSFFEDAMDAIQVARYSVRFGKPLAEEPKYPRQSQAVLTLLHRLAQELRKPGG